MRHVLATLALAVASLLAFSYQRFRSSTSSQLSPNVPRAALTPRVALVVLDGLREDRFLALMPRTRRMAESRGTVCSVQAPPITFTIAGIYTLGTGDMPTHALVPENFQTHAVNVDSLPHAVARAGGHTSLFGEKIWQDMYGAWAESETSRDLGPFAAHDGSGWANLAHATETKACNLCVMHDPQVDAIGHRGGVLSSEYASYLDDVDTKIASFSETRLDADTTWLITSDHGMLDAGGHGGDEAQARASFLAAFGPGIRHGQCEGRIAQADIPTSAAVLLGAPIPFSSRGTVPAFVAVPDREALGAELAAHQARLGAPPSESRQRMFMLLAIAPMLVALYGLVLASGGTVRWMLVLTAAPLVVFGWAFANVLYHHVSYGTATGIAFAAAVVPSALVPFAAARRARVIVALAVGALVAAEAHWVAQIQLLFLGLTCFFALEGRPRVQRVLASLGVAGLTLAIVEGAWLSAFVTRPVQGLVPHVLAMIATGGVAAMVFGRQRTAALRTANNKPRPAYGGSAIALGAALAYQVATTAPPFMRPWLPFAAMAALVALSPAGIAVTLFDVIASGLAVLFAMQAAPLHWIALCVVSWVATTSLSARALDAHPWLRGGAMLAVAYALTVVEGNRLRFEDVHVLAGFLGGALELHLPVTATLVALYYCAPIVLLLAIARWTGEPARRIRGGARAAAMIGLLKIAAMMVGFAWGKMAEGSWSMQLTELALLASWVVVLLFAQPLLTPSRNESTAAARSSNRATYGEAPAESKRF